jgi:hypothetical protein
MFLIGDAAGEILLINLTWKKILTIFFINTCILYMMKLSDKNIIYKDDYSIK